MNIEKIRHALDIAQSAHPCPLFEEALQEINRIPKNEPIFIIRAQDSSATALIQSWMALNWKAPQEKLLSAQRIREAMMEWPNRKNPD